MSWRRAFVCALMCGWSCLQGLSLCEVGLKPLLDKGGLPSPPATLLEVISALSQGPKMALSQRGLIALVSPFFCLTHLCSCCSISPTISRQDCSIGGWSSLSPAWNSDKGKVVKEYQGRSWYTESGPNLQVCSWYHGWKCHKRVFTIYCALIWLAGGGDGISGGPSPMSAALRGPCSFQAPTGLVVWYFYLGAQSGAGSYLKSSFKERCSVFMAITLDCPSYTACMMFPPLQPCFPEWSADLLPSSITNFNWALGTFLASWHWV